MDSRYGAELVTDKGKTFKFDAMECLINYKHDNPEITKVLHSEWTNVHNDNTSLIDATACSYLRSSKLPSPMGMYINAFEDQKSAEEFKNINGGIIYSWSELNNQFASMPALNQEN
jgi:copper chaperone NosL